MLNTIELLGTQTLCLGLEFAIRKQLSEWNDARRVLGLAPFSLHELESQQLETAEPEQRRRGRPRNSVAPAETRLLLPAAPRVKRKYVKKVAVAEPAPESARAYVEAATPKPKHAPHVQATKPKKFTSDETRALTGAATKADWDICREAGIKCSKRPSRNQVMEARRIVDARKHRAERAAAAA